jgi:coproporphyrinogen III oxidase
VALARSRTATAAAGTATAEAATCLIKHLPSASVPAEHVRYHLFNASTSLHRSVCFWTHGLWMHPVQALAEWLKANGESTMLGLGETHCCFA